MESTKELVDMLKAAKSKAINFPSIPVPETCVNLQSKQLLYPDCQGLHAHFYTFFHVNTLK